jgi:hypothetical protein
MNTILFIENKIRQEQKSAKISMFNIQKLLPLS